MNMKMNIKVNKSILRNILGLAIILICMSFVIEPLKASPIQVPNLTVNIGGEETAQGSSATLQMIFIITIIALAPSILIMMTSFLRLIVALHFLRSAIGTQTMPPNQILVGLALFLTFFVMSPVFMEIKTVSLDPLEKGQITQEQAIERGIEPLKSFMLRQAENEDVNLFMELANIEPFESEEQLIEELPLYVIVPAFIISELRAGFIIGFLVYIPFIIIDMVVAATLMSMGMMMLPPAMISLPFKILLFIMVDGWNLFIGQLIQTFN